MTLIICIILLLLTVATNAIVTNELQTRRAALSATMSTSASLAALTLVPTKAHAAAATESLANQEQERPVVPGTGMKAPLKNTIISDDTATATFWRPQSSITQLAKSRIDAKELSPLNPSFVPFATDNELYYDPILFGSWDVTSTLKQKTYPYGTQYLPSASLYEGSPRNRIEKPGDTTSYELHYFSSSNDYDNNNADKSSTPVVNVDLNQSISKLRIIADRSYNAISTNKAYRQLSKLEDVLWDYKKDPTRLTLQFGTLGEDMQPMGERRGEVYINARKSETGKVEDTNEAVFCTSERVRSVVLIPGDVVVSDTETITEYRVVGGSDGNHVKAISRIAVYLTPNPNSREGVLWQSVGGKAVAFFDYDIDLRRKLSDSKPFVLAPKGISQFGQ